MKAPTIGEITAAAKASAQSTPRPSRAFWIEAIRSYLGQSVAPRGALRVAFAHGLVIATASNVHARDELVRHTESLNEAAARARWGQVFGLCEEA